MPTLLKKVLVSVAVLLGLSLALEWSTRVLAPASASQRVRDLRHYLLTGEIDHFEPHPYRVYQRVRADPEVNAQGFNDVAWHVDRVQGVPRIVCLGGSTTEGGNSAGKLGSYPKLLERLLELQTGFDFEVLNAGMAGWTSAEMLVAWFLTLQDYAPDVVVLHEAVNDLEPRFKAGFTSDYWHWRTPMESHPAVGLEAWLVHTSDLYLHLRLLRGRVPNHLDVCTRQDAPWDSRVRKGELPPETSPPFRRNIRSIARAAKDGGATVVLMTLPDHPFPKDNPLYHRGILENNDTLRGLCREEGCTLADAERAFAARPEFGAEFLDGVHLTPKGNRAKAAVVAEALSGWLASLPDGPRQAPQVRSWRRWKESGEPEK